MTARVMPPVIEPSDTARLLAEAYAEIERLKTQVADLTDERDGARASVELEQQAARDHAIACGLTHTHNAPKGGPNHG